jgi:hypothetical protein
VEPLGATKQGVYGVTDLFTEQRKYDKDKSKFFVWRERGFASMVHVLITALPKVSVSDPEPKHFEDGYRPLKFPLTAVTIAGPAGASPETVDMTFPANVINNFVVGQEYENDSVFMSNTANPTFSATQTAVYSKHEVMIVIAVNTGTGVVTFRRHIGTDTRLGATVAPSTTDILYMHSIAATDGSGSPISFSQNPVVVNNFIQIFKEPYEITDTTQKTDIFGENEWQRKARNARRNFARQLERAFESGHKYSYADPLEGEGIKWMTGGLEEWFPEDTDHQIFLNKPPTLTLLNSTLKAVFDQGSEEKWGFCGYGALTKIANAAVDGIRFNDQLSKSLAMEVNDIKTAAGGVIHLVPAYEMSQTGRDNEVQIADVRYLNYMYLEGEDIHIDTGKNKVGLQANDAKRTKHQIYGTVGLKRTFRDSHYHLLNLL